MQAMKLIQIQARLLLQVDDQPHFGGTLNEVGFNAESCDVFFAIRSALYQRKPQVAFDIAFYQLRIINWVCTRL